MERSWTFFGLNRLFAYDSYDYSIFWAMDYDGIQYDVNQRGYERIFVMVVWLIELTRFKPSTTFKSGSSAFYTFQKYEKYASQAIIPTMVEIHGNTWKYALF